MLVQMLVDLVDLYFTKCIMVSGVKQENFLIKCLGKIILKVLKMMKMNILKHKKVENNFQKYAFSLFLISFQLPFSFRLAPIYFLDYETLQFLFALHEQKIALQLEQS